MTCKQIHPLERDELVVVIAAVQRTVTGDFQHSVCTALGEVQVLCQCTAMTIQQTTEIQHIFAIDSIAPHTKVIDDVLGGSCGRLSALVTL